MIPVLAFVILLNNHNVRDTMLLPIHGGRIAALDDQSKPPVRGLLITPSNDFSVRSCSNGRVRSVWQMGSDWCVMIALNDTFFTYAQMDTVLVNPGQDISTGDLIGERNMIPNRYNSIIFIVLKGNKELDPGTFILYKN
jgi:hypothetical protein